MKTDRSGPPHETLGTPCWVWSGRDNGRFGYGVFLVFYGGKRIVNLAHRFAYLLAVGRIPDDFDIDHLCRNRKCVNPAHLEPVTARVNILRGVGLTARFARATHCVNGHAFDEANTYYRNADKTHRSCRACSRINSARYTEARRVG